MSKAQIELVRSSWRALQGIDPYLLGDVFYSYLFMSEPSLRKLFKTSMLEQQKKLIDMISFIVMRLNQIDKLTEDIKRLAMRHESYGTKPKHYDAVGKALLWTLSKGLGKDWTKEVEDAWITCYTELSQTMLTSHAVS